MKRLFCIFLFTLISHDCWADIYKYTDKNGVTTYTNIKPEKNSKAELIISGPQATEPPPATRERKPASRAPSPTHFPKVDNQTQHQRDQKRRELLTSELEQEKQALEDAKQSYEEAQNIPEVYKGANGKTFRNVAKYEEKLRLIEAEIQAHERNIELLNKELNL
jgi:chromosome segregation ATPase